MKTIFITGGSGFIGKNILESYVAKKYSILAPKHKELELLDEDAVRKYFKDNKIDIVIHSAARPGHRNAKDPTNIFYSNTRAFFNIARNADLFRKMIVIGSGAVYDMRYYRPKMREEYFDQHVPVDEHGLCKYVCAKYMQFTDNIIDLRVFGIFGKYEDYAIRFISNAICKTLFDLPITIKQNRKFDYIYVNDLMSIIDYFISNNGKYKEYNITPDASIELYSLAEKVNKISDKNLPIIVKGSDMGLEYSGDNSRLKNEIKNLKFTEIDVAIKELYAWHEENKSLINKDLLLVDK